MLLLDSNSNPVFPLDVELFVFGGGEELTVGGARWVGTVVERGGGEPEKGTTVVVAEKEGR